MYLKNSDALHSFISVERAVYESAVLSLLCGVLYALENRSASDHDISHHFQFLGEALEYRVEMSENSFQAETF